jgi:hypothetical protein
VKPVMSASLRELFEKIMPPTLRPAQRAKRFQDFLIYCRTRDCERIHGPVSVYLDEVRIQREAREEFSDYMQRGIPSAWADRYRKLFAVWYPTNVSEKRKSNAARGWIGEAGKKRREKLKPEKEAKADHTKNSRVRVEAADWEAEKTGKTPVRCTE